MKFSLKSIAIIVVIHLSICFFIFITLSPHKEIYESFFPADVRNNLEKTFKKFEPHYNLISSKCKPHQNVYSPEELISIYKYNDYGPCSTPTNDLISYVDQSISVKCENNLMPLYTFDKSPEEVFGGSKKETIVWYESLPNIKSKQFLIIKCSKEATYALVFNRFKQTISDSKNEIRKKLGGNKKPMSVLLLVFDSISRFSFQRNLPNTKKFLQGLKDNEEFDDVFDVYDFDKTPVPVPRTVWNMAQILYGKSWEEISKVFDSAKKSVKNEAVLNYQKNAI